MPTLPARPQPFFGNPKKRHASGDRFSVLHFAGEVSYCVVDFIDKNNDTLYTDLEQLMVGSSQPLVAEMFDDAGLAAAEEALGEEAGGWTPSAAGDDAGHASPAAKKVVASAVKPKSQSVSTIASKFKAQLGLLNETLLATSPHYVR